MSVTITSATKDGTTITAQATADESISWTLTVVQTGGQQITIPAANSSSNNGVYTATWSNVPNGSSYTVHANGGEGWNESQGVS